MAISSALYVLKKWEGGSEEKIINMIFPQNRAPGRCFWFRCLRGSEMRAWSLGEMLFFGAGPGFSIDS